MSDPVVSFDEPQDALPSFELFDIVEVLNGRGYPETEVPFYMDEQAGLALNQANVRLGQLALLGKTDEHDALENKVDALKEKLKGSRYIYHLRGLPNKVRSDLLDDAFAKFPRKGNGIDQALGIETPDDQRDQYFSTKLLQAMTVKIVAPNGAVQVAPTFETIQQFRDYAPAAALEAINNGIKELTDGVKAGFEQAVQGEDFLSEA